MAKKTLKDPTALPSVFDTLKSVDESVEIISQSAMSNIAEWIPTGSYVLNACMSGDLFKAIPTGRVTVLAGTSGAGKSFLACSVCREAQKMGYTPIYLDSEGAIDDKFVARLGVDPNNFMIKKVSTIAETSKIIANMCDAFQKQQDEYGTHQKVIFVLDSLGNLTSDKEKTDTMDGNNKRDMTKAQEIKALFRVNATPLATLQIPLIVVNHVYACFSGDTKVQMGDGTLKPISEISKGEYVKTQNGSEAVTDKFEYNGKKCYELEFEDGYKVKCTFNHQFLVKEAEDKNVYKPAEDLTAEDEIVIALSESTIKLVGKSIVNDVDKVYDIEVGESHQYVLENGIVVHNCVGAYVPTNVQSGGSGIVYNASVTVELSAAKLDDKDNEKAASERQGAEATTRNGVLVTAKPVKSRFCRPIKVKFQIPYFKKPNPFVGLESFMTWENSGVVRGSLITQKEYEKMSESAKEKIHVFEYTNTETGEIQTLFCEPKDTARGIVVKHLGRQVSLQEFFSETVFTPEYLEFLNTNVIHPMFDLPSQESFDDIAEIENIISTGEQVEQTIKS